MENVRFVNGVSDDEVAAYGADQARVYDSPASGLFDNWHGFMFGMGDPLLLRWILKPDDTPAAVLFGRGNVHVTIAVQINKEGVVHLLA